MEDNVLNILLFLNIVGLIFFWKIGAYNTPLYNYSTKDRMFYRLKIRTKASTSTSKKRTT